MLLSKKPLFSTLGFQITKDFVWESKAGGTSTLNCVWQLYLITWNERTNLIRFYWNLNHLVPNMKYLANFYPVQFQDPQGGPRDQIMEGQCRLKKTIKGFQSAVFLMFICKNKLFMTLGSLGRDNWHIKTKKIIDIGIKLNWKYKSKERFTLTWCNVNPSLS